MNNKKRIQILFLAYVRVQFLFVSVVVLSCLF